MTGRARTPARVRETSNPFRIGGVVTGEHFTDRAPERRRIKRSLTSAQDHLLVFGPRRMGKTSTLCVVHDELVEQGRAVVMADLSTASVMSDVTNRVLQAAARSLGRRWKDVVTALVQRLSVKVGLAPDATTGALLPSLDLSVREGGIEAQRASLANALDAIDDLAASKHTHVGIILDEFQELHRFGGEQAEAHLRGIIQRHRHASYVLAGSDERLIRAMTGARRPLYKLLELLHFGPMPADHLATWIESRLDEAGVRSKDAGALIVRIAGPRTRDVVQLARSTFEVARPSGRAGEAEIGEAFRQVVLSEDAPIRALWEGLSPLQQNVLRAVAERSEGLTTKETRRRFALGETGTATKAAQTLLSRDILVKHANGYAFDSPFMRGWVVANALPDLGISLPITHVA